MDSAGSRASASPPTLAELVVADEPHAWAALGFSVDGDRCVVDGVTIRFTGATAGRGLVAWRLDGTSGDIDGLPTAGADARPRPAAGGARRHPNGVDRLDHVVVLTADLQRTLAAAAAAGLHPRRTVEGNAGGRAVTYAFFRLGPAILELIGPSRTGLSERAPGTPAPPLPDDGARFWGMAFATGDLDALAQRLGDRLGPARDAVQPGRRIASLRREAGLTVPVAFMTPRVDGAQG